MKTVYIALPRWFVGAMAALFLVLAGYVGFSTWYISGAFERTTEATEQRNEQQASADQALVQLTELQAGLCKYADVNQDVNSLLVDLLGDQSIIDEFDPATQQRIRDVQVALSDLDNLEGCPPR